jgi:DNA-binding LacI/PurR family transcriptional regulator
MDQESAESQQNSDGQEASIPKFAVRTITDLAKLAGVSPGTVSRALAKSDKVNARTRDRIEAIAKEHNFQLNQMASKLRRRQTGIIGAVIPLGHERSQHISDPFFTNLLGHIADALTENGYDLMLRRVIPRREEDWLGKLIGTGLVEGVLVVGQSDQFNQIERIAQDYRPMVVWGNYRAGQRHCVVGVNNERGGFMALDHLVKSGARRIAFMGDSHAVEFAARHSGAGAAAKQHGVGLLNLPTHLSLTRMREEISRHLDQHLASIDGIFAAADQIASEVLRQLLQRGVQVPGQVQLVGFDDLPLADQTTPGLTTIRQNIEYGGHQMVELLLRRLNGEDTESVVMDPVLIVRESTRGQTLSK